MNCVIPFFLWISPVLLISIDFVFWLALWISFEQLWRVRRLSRFFYLPGLYRWTPFQNSAVCSERQVSLEEVPLFSAEDLVLESNRRWNHRPSRRDRNVVFFVPYILFITIEAASFVPGKGNNRIPKIG